MASQIKKCPECGSKNLMHDEQRGEVICGNCGLVIEEKMIDAIKLDVPLKVDITKGSTWLDEK